MRGEGVRLRGLRGGVILPGAWVWCVWGGRGGVVPAPRGS